MLIDVLFVILMVMAIFKGISRGLIVAVLSFIALLIGLAAALKLSAIVANYLRTNMNLEGRWLPVLSFIIVFAGVVLFVRWAAVLLKKTAGIIMLGWLDKLGGVMFFALINLMIYSVVLFYASQLNLLSTSLKNDSKTYAYVYPLAPKVINGVGLVIPFFSNLFADLSSFFGKAAAQNR